MHEPIAPTRWLAGRMLAFTLLLPGLIAAYAPYWWIVGPSRVASLWPPSGAHMFALAPITIGVAVYVLCAWRFAVDGLGTPAPWDPPRQLVTTGLYRLARNPMYVGIVTLLLGEAWLTASPAMLAYAACVAVAFHLRVVLYEEPVLRQLFGEAFGAYARRVRRWGVV